MRRPVTTALPVIVTLLAACGGTPPPVEAPKPAATVAEPGGGGVTTTPDLSPVSMPKNVVLLARANDPDKTLSSVEKLVKLSRPIRSLLDEALSKEKVDFLVLGASYDIAVAIDPESTDKDPKFLWAFSVPVKGTDQVAEFSRKDGDEVRSSTPGGYRIKDKSTLCDVVPTPGDAPARVICSDDEESLRELTPWLARGVSAQPKKAADLWLRAEAAPLKDKFLPGLRQQADEGIADLMKELRGAPISLDPELLDVPNVLAREAFALGDDVDSFEMAFSLDAAKPEMRTTMTLGFKSRTSWVTDLVARSVERADPAPEMFFRLPKDAVTATWSRSAAPSTFAGIRRVLHKSATAGLSFLPMLSDADRQAFVGWVDAVPSFSGLWVSSSGSSARKPPLQGKLTAAQAIDEAKETAKQWIPWGVAGGEGDPSAMIAWLKQTETAYGRAVALVKKDASKSAQKDLALLPTVKFSANVAGFPKGSAALDVNVHFSSKDVWDLLPQNKYQEQPGGRWGHPEHPKGAEAKGEITLRIVVVPEDAGHYWFGYAVDPELLKKQIAAVQRGASTAGTIASRTDLGLLKSHKGFGGFVSYGSLLDPLHTSSLSSSDQKDLAEVLSAMPHKGQSPIFFLGSGSGGNAPSVTFDFVAPKDFVEDVSGAVKHFADKELSRVGSPPPASTPVAARAKVDRSKLPAECRDYLKRMDACLTKIGGQSQDPMRQAMQDNEEAWATASADPAGRKALVDGCKAALDALKANAACK
jgi:hypothetical protein